MRVNFFGVFSLTVFNQLLLADRSANTIMIDEAVNEWAGTRSIDVYDTVKWINSTKSCDPDLCNGAFLSDIPDYNNQIKIGILLHDPHIVDTKYARECLNGKSITLIGDSTLTETTHDMALLLSGLSSKNDINRYLNKFCSRNQMEIAPGNFSGNDGYSFAYEYDDFTGHRNLTFRFHNENNQWSCVLRHRFNGGGKGLHLNSVGISGMVTEDMKEENDCLFGITCKPPDILVYQSAIHDVGHGEKYKTAFPLLMSQLQMLKSRGTKVFWKTSIPVGPSYEEILQINNLAAFHAARNNIFLIDMSIPNRLFNKYYPDIITELHVGGIAYLTTHNLLQSSYYTQYILNQICKYVVN